MSENAFEKLIYQILTDYATIFGFVPDNIEYRFADDMREAYIEIRPDYAIRAREKLLTVDQYTGLTVPPYDIDGKFYVLLNRAKVLEYIQADNMTWIGTIAHETTHVKDFIDFANLIGAKDYEDITDIRKHLTFQLWTEANARAKGYFFVRKYSFNDMYDEAQIPDILNAELPWQFDYLQKQVASTTDGAVQTYHIAHFIGRLYTLSQVFPCVFTREWVKEYFGESTWLYEWYVFFSEHQSVKSAYNDNGAFMAILRQHYMDL